jgi:hypothetical protein
VAAKKITAVRQLLRGVPFAADDRSHMRKLLHRRRRQRNLVGAVCGREEVAAV